MRLNDTETVDYLGLEKGGGAILVTLVDECDWTDEIHHLSLLQRKVNRYFDFIESGEVYEQLAEVCGKEVSRDLPVKINILAKYEPSGEGHRFLEHIERAAEEAKVGFAFKVLPTRSQDA